MSISYRRECYSTNRLPTKYDTDSSEESLAELESLTTIKKGLFPMLLLLKKIIEVNLKKILEWRKNNIEESDEEIHSETECSSSKTCYCIKVYISNKVSSTMIYESNSANSGQNGSSFGPCHKPERVVTTMRMAKTMRTSRRPDRRLLNTYKTLKRAQSRRQSVTF